MYEKYFFTSTLLLASLFDKHKYFFCHGFLLYKTKQTSSLPSLPSSPLYYLENHYCHDDYNYKRKVRQRSSFACSCKQVGKTHLKLQSALGKHDDGSDNDYDSSNSVSVKIINGPFTIKNFALTKCWGRQPLLIKSALTSNEINELLSNENQEKEEVIKESEEQQKLDEDPTSIVGWPSWDDVLDMATDNDVSSRLIQQHDANDLSSFTLDVGPFDKKELNDLTTTRNNDMLWTIVINDIDRFYLPLANWIERKFSHVTSVTDRIKKKKNDVSSSQMNIFEGIPRWRRDDGQISIASQGGSIGPHVDNYDVFLIQMNGVRQWNVKTGYGAKISTNDEISSLIPNIDVRILSSWDDDDDDDDDDETTNIESHVLYPGDMLYLPPRVGHYGISKSNDCMTLSIGCRSPSAYELVSKITEVMSESFHIESVVQRYTEDIIDTTYNGVDSGVADSSKNRQKQKQKQQQQQAIQPTITNETKNHMKQMVMNSINDIINDDLLWDEIVGTVVTECKRPTDGYPIKLDLELEDEHYCDDHDHDHRHGEDDDHDDYKWDDPKFTIQSVLLDGYGKLVQVEGISFAYSFVDEVVVTTTTTTTNTDTDDNTCIHHHHHRLFANGEMYEIVVVDRGNDGNSSNSSNLLLPSITNETRKKNNEIISKIMLCIVNRIVITKELILSFQEDSNNNECHDDNDDVEKTSDRTSSKCRSDLKNIISNDIINFLEEMVTNGLLYGTD